MVDHRSSGRRRFFIRAWRRRLPLVALGGWFDNWSWAADGVGELARPVRVAAVVVAFVSAIMVVSSWVARGIGFSPWLVVPIVAIGVDLVIFSIVDASYAFESSRLGYANAFVLAAGLVLGARALGDPAAQAAFAVVGPALAVASAPLLSRAWAATLFAHRMIGFIDERRERIRAALAGASSSLVARVERIAEAEVELVVLGASERQLRAATKVIAPHATPRVGRHVLLEEPVFAEMPEVDGYRGSRRFYRLESIKTETWLSNDLWGSPSDVYAAEVRAGALVMAAYHAVLVGAALALTR
jgi:hypothetical protein